MRIITLLAGTDENVSDGVWIDVSRYITKTANITGLTAAGQIEIRVSARDSIPLNTEHESLSGAAHGTGDINKPIAVTEFCSFIKARKITGGAGTGNTRVTLLVGDSDDSGI